MRRSPALLAIKADKQKSRAHTHVLIRKARTHHRPSKSLPFNEDSLVTQAAGNTGDRSKRGTYIDSGTPKYAWCLTVPCQNAEYISSCSETHTVTRSHSRTRTHTNLHNTHTHTHTYKGYHPSKTRTHQCPSKRLLLHRGLSDGPNC